MQRNGNGFGYIFMIHMFTFLAVVVAEEQSDIPYSEMTLGYALN